MIASQLAAGRSRLPVRKKDSSSITSSMAANELKEIIIPTEKPASILDWNNCPSESGEYSNVSKVCFSFSPTKELAAMTDDAMIGDDQKEGWHDLIQYQAKNLLLLAVLPIGSRQHIQ